jgi:RNA polymerase sigma factor
MDLPGKDELESKVREAWQDYQDGDGYALDRLLEMLAPFCLRVASKTCCRIITNSDDEASIARMAIIEALGKYDSAQGVFLVYLGRVIRNRIIDYKRKESKRRTIPFSLLGSSDRIPAGEVDDSFFAEVVDDLARRQEIEKLQGLLAEYSISFADLLKASPGQEKTREKAKQIALWIAGDEELRSHLLEKKLLPLRAMEGKWPVNRKLADRYRKFIIAAVLIHSYEFPYLQTYVTCQRGG